MWINSLSCSTGSVFCIVSWQLVSCCLETLFSTTQKFRRLCDYLNIKYRQTYSACTETCLGRILSPVISGLSPASNYWRLFEKGSSSKAAYCRALTPSPGAFGISPWWRQDTEPDRLWVWSTLAIPTFLCSWLSISGGFFQLVITGGGTKQRCRRTDRVNSSVRRADQQRHFQLIPEEIEGYRLWEMLAKMSVSQKNRSGPKLALWVWSGQPVC